MKGGVVDRGSWRLRGRNTITLLTCRSRKPKCCFRPTVTGQLDCKHVSSAEIRVGEVRLRHPDTVIGIHLCWSLTGQHVCACSTHPQQNKEHKQVDQSWTVCKVEKKRAKCDLQTKQFPPPFFLNLFYFELLRKKLNTNLPMLCVLK